MVTTVQVDEKTIMLLKRIKVSLAAASYDEAISKLAVRHLRPQHSMAGSLARYFKNYSTASMVREIKEERKKFDKVRPV